MSEAPAGRVVTLAQGLARYAPWIAAVLFVPALLGGIELDDLYLVTTNPSELLASAFTVVGDGPRTRTSPRRTCRGGASRGCSWTSFARPLR